jgi:hypothetical protein
MEFLTPFWVGFEGGTCQFGHQKHHHSVVWTVGSAFFGDLFDASPLFLGLKLTPRIRFGDLFGISSPPQRASKRANSVEVRAGVMRFVITFNSMATETGG